MTEIGDRAHSPIRVNNDLDAHSQWSDSIVLRIRLYLRIL